MTILTLNESAAETANSVNEFAGFASPRRWNVTESQIDQANDFLVRMSENRVTRQQVAEAFSSSDFTMAAFAAIDTRLMAAYAELPSVWRQYTDVIPVSDFRPARLLDKWSKILGLMLVPELTEYQKAGGNGFDQWWINVVKYGLVDGISFEAQINNEAIGEIQDMPGKLARAAGETESINALSNLLKVDANTNLASDLNTDFFKSGNENAPLALPMTAENIDTLIDSLMAKKSKRGRLQAAPPLQIVHPRSLTMQANRIKNLRQIEVTNGTTKNTYDNYLKVVDFVEEPMLDVINTHTKAATTWFVLPKTGQIRPASFAAFLRGYEKPDLRVRNNQGTRVGGGAISPMEGSYEIDSIDYRARHIVGHQVGDPTFTAVSYGS